jgi:primary-amine oxidase
VLTTCSLFYFTKLIRGPSTIMSADQATTASLRPDGSDPSRTSLPHPLDQLSVAESNLAREVILKRRGADVTIHYRSICLEEPPKEELSRYLELEHSGKLTGKVPRPARLAKVQYDIVRADRTHEYTESLVDVVSGNEVMQRTIDKLHQPALTTYAKSFYLQILFDLL